MLKELKKDITREKLIDAIQTNCAEHDECTLCPLVEMCCDNGDLWALAENREPENEVDNETLAEAFAKIAAFNAHHNGGTAAEAKHYQVLPVQPIEIMQKLMSPEAFLGFCFGNVIKYSLRCGQKDTPVKEMEKVRQYADWYVRASGGETIDPRKAA